MYSTLNRKVAFWFLAFSLAWIPSSRAAEVVIHLPDDKLAQLLDDTFKWYHTFSEQCPVYGKSDSEKLAYCMDKVIGIASFGRVNSLKEIGAEVEVKR